MHGHTKLILQSSFISLKGAVNIGTLHETRTYGKTLWLLSLNGVASEITAGFLKLFSAQCSQIFWKTVVVWKGLRLRPFVPVRATRS